MRELQYSHVAEWLQTLDKLKRQRTCTSPGFLMPYHFVTLAMTLRQCQAANLTLPDEVAGYAARMKLWEAIGLVCPRTVNAKPSQANFFELTPLTALDRAQEVAEALSKMMVKQSNHADAAGEDYFQNLYTMTVELLSNCFDHARVSDGLHGLVCAQTWYQGRRAQIAIADDGIGIRASLMENSDLAARLANGNACKLATKVGISSKLNSGHAGYGLALAEGLARLTPGATLLLQSCDEYFLASHKRASDGRSDSYSFHGTLIVFEWDIRTSLDARGVYTSWPPGGDGDDDSYV